MKRFYCSIVLLLLVVFGGSIARASAADVITVPCDQDFVLSQAITTDENDLVLVGWTGTPMQPVPTMLAVSTDGVMRWEIKKNNVSRLFYDVISLGDHQVLALRSSGEGRSASVGEIVSNGQTIGEISNLANVYRILGTADGFILFCKDDFESCRLEKRSMSGELLWKTELPEPIMILDIIVQDGNYIAIGRKQDDREGFPKSVMFQVDDAGNILCRYDSDSDEEYIKAVPADDGSLVLIGNAFESRRYISVDSIYAYSFIAKFNKENQIWRTDFRYESDNRPRDGYADAIVQVDNGYLVAARGSRKRSEVMMQHYDADGRLLQSWFESTGSLYNPLKIMLFPQNGKAILVANGYARADDLQNYVSILKPILLGDE